jgi:hypothetical protein
VKVVSYSNSHSAEKYVIPVANRPKAPPKARRAISTAPSASPKSPR